MPLVYRKNSSEHSAEILSYNPIDSILTVHRTDGEVRTIELSNVIEFDADLDMSALENAPTFLRDAGAAGFRSNDDQTKMIRVEEGGEYVGPEYSESVSAESASEESGETPEKEIVIAACLLVLILFFD